jgi:putative methionine-R-sulfoxide reductase with GAF domain
VLNPLPLDELTAVFARIKGLLLTEEKVDRAVQLLVLALRDAVPGTAGAGISLLDARGKGSTTTSTSPFVGHADAAQYELGEGPCVTAWTGNTTVIADDAVADARWPLWGQAITALPVRSLVSTPLVISDAPIGTLKIYAALPGAYSAQTGRLLEKFAVPAAILLSNIQGPETPRRMSGPLKGALIGRDTANRACGILMERHGLTAEEAFQQLLRLARTSSTPLSEICADIVGGSRRELIE